MVENSNSMGSEDVARIILEYLADNEVALPPGYVHHQLELYRNATWHSDTTRRRLKDFHKADWVNRIDRGKGLYEISELGEEKVSQGLTDEELSEIIGIADN